jgi:hypothetical protein
LKSSGARLQIKRAALIRPIKRSSDHNDNGAIVMADQSLPLPTTFKHISVHMIHILARLQAKRLVQDQLRAEGVRVTLVGPAEISARAQAYLADHPELYRQALERAQLMEMYEPKRRRA